MRTYKEWHEEATMSSNPELLYSNLEKLAHLAEAELRQYDGDREDGFLDLIGSVQSMLKTIAALKHGVDQPKFLSQE
ncbi:MAG: hypothetical protein ACW99G_01450 [Candidatus Thorarchaeota archaeon]|jgi:hypothetical protein